LLLPDDWAKILLIKWLAPLWQIRWVGPLLVGFWIANAALTMLHPLSVPLLALSVAVHLAFCASLGLWLSVVCRTSVQALTVLGTVLLGLTVAPWLLAPVGGNDWAAAVSPPAAYWSLCFSWSSYAAEPGGLAARVIAPLLGAVGYGVAALVFWKLARRCFVGPPLDRRRKIGSMPAGDAVASTLG
jgi:hypothetical protein